jgi:Leucine-rich repeat (LRR) protein
MPLLRSIEFNGVISGDLSALQKQKTIESVYIYNTREADYSTLFANPYINNINIFYSNFDEDNLKAISENSKIINLYLRNCGITDLTPLLPLAKTLRVLDIKENQIRDYSLLKSFSELSALYVDTDEKTMQELKAQLKGVYIE